MADLHGVRANAVVLDERQLTQRVSSNDVKLTFADFQKRVAKTDGADAELILSTTETTEARASSLLDLGEGALARLFGRDAKVDISVITSQSADSARLRVSAPGMERVAAALGVSGIDSTQIENFVAQRASTEYQLMLLKFNNTDLLPSVDIVLELMASSRTLSVGRQQRFR
jgi:hypothetical protein